ncbi:MAG: RNA polymerase factor sigma-54 [Bacteroidales bacterium]|nr:RNA polymerase factor sigma-54 [Bacteroidales bacterium]
MAKQNLSQTQTIRQTIVQKPVQIQAAKILEVQLQDLAQKIEAELDENPALERVEESDSYLDDAEKNENEEFNETENQDASENEEWRELDSQSEYDRTDAGFEDFADDFDDGDYSDYELKKINRSKDDVEYEPIAIEETSFQESLLKQISLLDISERERQIAIFIVGYLDDRGYLDQSSKDLADILNYNNSQSDLNDNCASPVSADEMEKVITTIIQTLEPLGIGARSIQESILLQIKPNAHRMPYSAAELVVRHFFNELSKKHYEVIMKKTNLSQNDLEAVLQVIRKVNPFPGDALNSIERVGAQVIPDFTILEEDDKLKLILNKNCPIKVRVSKEYVELYKNLRAARQKKRTKEMIETEEFLKKNIVKAEGFVNSLSMREETMKTTMLAIIGKQKEYFLTGDPTMLKPMILNDIAEATGYDKSTVSRVTSNKYVQTNFGIISLKSLFSESIGSEDVSSKEVKAIIQSLVDEENKKKPMSDDELCSVLLGKGYAIARRTVAKYREELKIPVSRLRKTL